MSNKVTYNEIVEALAGKTGFSKNKSEAFIKGIIGLVKEDLEENGKAVITNFGSFTVKEVAERQGQNPQTGEPITIPAHKRVTFSPYKPLREKVNAPFAHLETELLEEDSGAAQSGSKTKKKEPEPEISPKSETGSSRKKENDNTGLMIATVLLLVIVALASGWFLMTADEDATVAEDAAIETPQTPEASEAVEEVASAAETEAEEMVQEQPESDQPEPAEQNLSENPETINQTTSGTIEMMESYQVQSGEWYWVIADKVYGESGFWPLLFQANETIGDDPDQLYPSMGLEVPNLEGSVQRPSRSDYRRMAEASTIVSEAYRRAGKTEKAAEYARFAEKWKRQSQE